MAVTNINGEHFFFVLEISDRFGNFNTDVRSINSNYMFEVLYMLLSWFFAFDNVHYACWLTIHWFDMYNLESKFPDLFEQFSSGSFSFQKTDRGF